MVDSLGWRFNSACFDLFMTFAFQTGISLFS
jgi:hypothetical protein